MTYGDFDRASRICVFSVQDCPYRINGKCVLAPYMLAKGEDEKETQFCYLRFVPEWRFNRLPSKKSVKVELQDSDTGNIIETLSPEDLITLMSKTKTFSGVFVDRKI